MPNMCTFLLLLSSIAIILALGPAPARGQGNVSCFAYDFHGGGRPTTLSYQGDAHFASDTTFLRMTTTGTSGDALSYSVGRAVHAAPVTFWQAGAQVDFETTFKFIIKPNPGDTDVPADGFSFFIAPVGSAVGYTGASYGVFDLSGSNPSAFAAEFDIFSNPGVDPSYRHIGIDIGSNVSKNTTDVGDAFLVGHEVTARVVYKQHTKLITVSASAGGRTFEVRYVFDLSKILPRRVQVGISGATGGEVAVHELISWYFTSILVGNGGGSRKHEGRCFHK